MNQLLTPKKAAAAANVDQETLRQASDRGQLATQYTPGGHRRYRLSDLQALFPAASRPGPRLYLRMLIVAPEELLEEIFNHPDLLNSTPAGPQLARAVEEEIDYHPRGLWGWLEEKNLEYNVLIHLDNLEDVLRCAVAADSEFSARNCPAIDISSESDLDLSALLGTNDRQEALEELQMDYSDQEVVDLCQRAGLFDHYQVRFFAPKDPELLARERQYY